MGDENDQSLVMNTAPVGLSSKQTQISYQYHAPTWQRRNNEKMNTTIPTLGMCYDIMAGFGMRSKI